MAKIKVYAVRIGRQTGLFYSWADCEKQVKGFPNAEYKSFKEENDAIRYLEAENPKEVLNDAVEKEIQLTKELSYKDGVVVIYTDGSYANTNYSYGFLQIDKGEITYEECGVGKNPDALSMQNISGEILGTIKSILYVIKNTNAKEIFIFADYKGIKCWPDGEWECTNSYTQYYTDFINKYRKKIKISFVTIKGHNKNPYNERADQLARKALGL